ncbi:MAG: endonuclease/exonuclease/phosphatase family protein [Hungatella sp.]|nr:endonuclease/exonuclease/phosphatase family protein [Hungatella sp.]
MKLITLNTHSLAEPDYENKLHLFADLILRERPDVLALQEVNQTMAAEAVSVPKDLGFHSCPGLNVPVRSDNHAFRLAKLFREAGLACHWTWAPVKVGYEIYEEGLALFSRLPVEDTRQFFISRSRSFSNWKTRKMVGILAGGQWFYSVHMGWWKDEEEPFALQWDRALEELETHRQDHMPMWVMGDFNSPCGVEGEGYGYVRRSGWQDTYDLAARRDSGITVGKVIDGWREEGAHQAGMRIDYIWCDRPVKVCSSQVICNGIHSPVVSDHYGIMITTES